MKNQNPNYQFEWVPPLFLAVLSILSFGIFIPFLGYYWDDWAKILVARLQGLSSYWPYYVGDRPLSAWTHIALTPLLGDRPAAWLTFTLGMRFLSAWGIFCLLKLIKPRNEYLALIAASIFVTFPLFSQQAIAVTFHQQWMQFALIIWAFYCMVRSIHDRKHAPAWTILSLSLSIMQLSITEYFAPLELLRPILVWFSLPESTLPKEKIKRTVFHWMPYFVLLAGFVIIRVFFMPFSGDDPYRTETLFNMASNPIGTLSWLGRVLVVDLSHIFFGQWAAVFQSRLSLPLSLTFTAIFFGSILVGIGAAIFFIRFSRNSDKTDKQATGWTKIAVYIGLTGTLLGPIPAWITGRQVVFDFHSDRYALAAIFGLSILTSGIINWLGKSRVQKAALAGLIIALGCGYQLRTANDYRGIWVQQMRLYWQLFWRAPGLKTPTAVYSENELIADQGLFSMAGALNQLYPQHSRSDLLDYWFYTLLPKYQAGPPAKVNVSNNSTFRTLHFIGNSPDTLLIHQDPLHGNCLWIMRPEDKYNPYLSDLVKGMLPLSNLDRIESTGTEGYPPESLFGTEPDHDWCYYYQKADLAWQLHDWDTIVQIGELVKTQGLSPVSGVSNSPREWWPFIVGYANASQVRDAITLSQQSLKQDEKYHAAICDIWCNLTDVPEMGVGLSELGCEVN